MKYGKRNWAKGDWADALKYYHSMPFAHQWKEENKMVGKEVGITRVDNGFIVTTYPGRKRVFETLDSLFGELKRLFEPPKEKCCNGE